MMDHVSEARYRCASKERYLAEKLVQFSDATVGGVTSISSLAGAWFVLDQSHLDPNSLYRTEHYINQRSYTILHAQVLGHSICHLYHWVSVKLCIHNICIAFYPLHAQVLWHSIMKPASVPPCSVALISTDHENLLSRLRQDSQTWQAIGTT